MYGLLVRPHVGGVHEKQAARPYFEEMWSWGHLKKEEIAIAKFPNFLFIHHDWEWGCKAEYIRVSGEIDLGFPSQQVELLGLSVFGNWRYRGATAEEDGASQEYELFGEPEFSFVFLHRSWFCGFRVKLRVRGRFCG